MKTSSHEKLLMEPEIDIPEETRPAAILLVLRWLLFLFWGLFLTVLGFQLGFVVIFVLGVYFLEMTTVEQT
jgi:hypothetical protein